MRDDFSELVKRFQGDGEPERSDSYKRGVKAATKEITTALDKLQQRGPMAASVSAGEYRQGFNDTLKKFLLGRT